METGRPKTYWADKKHTKAFDRLFVVVVDVVVCQLAVQIVKKCAGTALIHQAFIKWFDGINYILLYIIIDLIVGSEHCEKCKVQSSIKNCIFFFILCVFINQMLSQSLASKVLTKFKRRQEGTRTKKKEKKEKKQAHIIHYHQKLNRKVVNRLFVLIINNEVANSKFNRVN